MTNLVNKVNISGKRYAKENFRLIEEKNTLDMQKIFDVLQGDLAAYCIRDFIPQNDCEKIENNFWCSSFRTPRLGYGEEGVEGFFLGSSHIEKTTQEYLEEAARFSEPVQTLYRETSDPIGMFRNLLSSQMKVRPAVWNGLQAGHSKAVYWSSLGEFLLQPHDDLAQLSDPRQSGFEIQQAKRVMAVNFYAKVPKNAGQLKIWNIEPDEKTKQSLNIEHSGFPYPAHLLKEFENLIVNVGTGDLCIINGNLIHAVMRGDKLAQSKDRLLITCFMAFNHNQDLIWWT